MRTGVWAQMAQAKCLVGISASFFRFSVSRTSDLNLVVPHSEVLPYSHLTYSGLRNVDLAPVAVECRRKSCGFFYAMKS
jgi:hypothetical protein